MSATEEEIKKMTVEIYKSIDSPLELSEKTEEEVRKLAITLIKIHKQRKILYNKAIRSSE